MNLTFLVKVILPNVLGNKFLHCVCTAGSIALGQYIFPFSLQLPDDLPGSISQLFVVVNFVF